MDRLAYTNLVAFSAVKIFIVMSHTSVVFLSFPRWRYPAELILISLNGLRKSFFVIELVERRFGHLDQSVFAPQDAAEKCLTKIYKCTKK
jgi:hypothetical protein